MVGVDLKNYQVGKQVPPHPTTTKAQVKQVVHDDDKDSSVRWVVKVAGPFRKEQRLNNAIARKKRRKVLKQKLRERKRASRV